MKELNMKANHHPEKVIPVFAVIIFFLSNSYNIPVIAQEDYDDHEWSMFMANPMRNGYINSSLQINPPLIWSYRYGNNSPSDLNIVFPAASHGELFISANNLTILDIHNGRKLKQINTDTGYSYVTVVRDMVFAKDKMIFLNNDTIIKTDHGYGLIVGSSQPLEFYSAGGEYGDGYLYARYVLNGTILWKKIYPFPQTRPLVNLVSDGRILCGRSWGEGQIECFEIKTGKLLWNSTGHGIGTMFARLMIFDGKVFIMLSSVYLNSTAIVAYNLLTGLKIWEKSFANYSLRLNYLAGGYGRIFAQSSVSNSSMKRYLFCLNASTGEIVWQQTLRDSVLGPHPIVADGKVIVWTGENTTSNESYLHMFDAFNGKLLWEVKFNDGIRVDPIVYDGVLVTGNATTIFAYGLYKPPLIENPDQNDTIIMYLFFTLPVIIAIIIIFYFRRKIKFAGSF
jgi:outer membrane protein assembly factor BamB